MTNDRASELNKSIVNNYSVYCLDVCYGRTVPISRQIRCGWVDKTTVVTFVFISVIESRFVCVLYCFIELPMLITLDTIGEAKSLIEILV